jgi:hypothetical protein
VEDRGEEADNERAKAKAANEGHRGDGWVGEAHEAA